MKISVIIPTYNRAELVKKAVESVLNQTYPPYEIIVVDDGSGPRGPVAAGYIPSVLGSEILRSRGAISSPPRGWNISTPRHPSVLKTLINKENKGVAAARNIGIKESKGDWLAFLDSDDYWLPEKLEKQVKFHAENTDILISQTDEVWIRNGQRINPKKYHAKPEGDIFELSLARCLVSPSAVVLNRKLLDTVGLFDESLPVCEDYDLWLRISSKYLVGLVKDKLVIKTGGHADQLSQKYWGMDRFRVMSLKKLLKDGCLTAKQEKVVKQKLKEKLTILENGALKRGKLANLKLSFSYRREFEELIEEIAVRDNIERFEVLEAPEIQAVLGHEKLSAPQKIKKIKEVLLVRRYPTYAKTGEAFSRQLKILNPFPKTKITSTFKETWAPSKIIIEKSVAKEPITKNVLSKFTSVPVEYADEVKLKKTGFKTGELLIAKQKGRFLKKCPCTPKHHSCNYYVLNLGIGCTFNCTYCFLHHYMNTPFMVYANTAGLIDEVEEFSLRNPDKTFRIGSGEFVDSVGFDELTGLNQTLIPTISRNKNILFEVKTKSRRIEHLLNLEHNNRVVVSWSLNTEKVIRQDEQGAAPLKERIEAARLCEEAGYKIGFHFDPLIYYPSWEEDYRQVVSRLFEHVKAENIAWISLGALRFNPSLKPIIKQKFPHSRLVYGELVPGADGKMRYFIAIRQKMFEALMKFIRSYSTEVPVYLCMESKELAKQMGVIAKF